MLQTSIIIDHQERRIYMFQQNEVKISDSEWLIMQVIWNKSPLYMGDIVSALSYTPWRRTTIQTMVARLVTKNVIATNRTGYAFLYYPLITREDAVNMYTKSFIERVYRGNAGELVAAVAESDMLKPDDKKRLKKLF